MYRLKVSKMGCGDCAKGVTYAVLGIEHGRELKQFSGRRGRVAEPLHFG